MKTCCFLGNSKVKDEKKLRTKLYNIVFDLVENKGVDFFYVAESGEFQKTVHTVLSGINQVYPEVLCCVELAHNPLKYDGYVDQKGLNNIYSAETDNLSFEAAEKARNCRMLKESDIVITYSAGDISIKNKEDIKLY